MFHGSLVAIVTPMKENGDIDYKAFESLVDWHLEHKTDGLVVLGTTGESATVEPDERKRLIEQTVAQVKERVPVIVGTGANATSHAIALTQEAMVLGANAALLVTPYYNKPTQEGLYQHYKAVAEAVPIPQILYNVPSRTACDLLPNTVERLSKFSNIVGLKEATGDIKRLKELAGLDMDLFSGDDLTAMEFILEGGKGVISVVANIAPKQVHDLCVAASNGDKKEAKKINDQLMILNDNLYFESNPIPVKWALSEMGLIPRGIRLPLTPLDQQYHSTLKAALTKAQVKA